MSTYIIITFIILGIVLLMMEFLVFPGVAIPGIAGTIFIIGGIVSAFYFHPGVTANLITISTFVLMILVVTVTFKTKTWQRFGLKSEIDSHASVDVAQTYKVGDKGKSVSRMAPIGTIMINNDIIEARSLGGFIDPNTEIIVVKTEKNKLFVEPIN
jgi:membrane-bound ClpP family serine protease